MKHPPLFTLSLCCALAAASAQAQPDPIPERALVNALLLDKGAKINPGDLADRAKAQENRAAQRFSSC